VRHATRRSVTGWRCLGTLLGLGLAAALAGCGPSGVGSVDFDKDPDARTIGAAPRPKPGQNPQRPPIRPSPKKHREYDPG
jgi:hypothetical protein